MYRELQFKCWKWMNMWQILSSAIVVVDVVGGWKIRLEGEHRWQHRSLQGWRIWLCHKMQKPGKCDTPHSRTCHAWVFPWLKSNCGLECASQQKDQPVSHEKLVRTKSQTHVKELQVESTKQHIFSIQVLRIPQANHITKKTSRLHVTIPRFQQVLIGESSSHNRPMVSRGGVNWWPPHHGSSEIARSMHSVFPALGTRPWFCQEFCHQVSEKKLAPFLRVCMAIRDPFGAAGSSSS